MTNDVLLTDKKEDSNKESSYMRTIGTENIAQSRKLSIFPRRVSLLSMSIDYLKNKKKAEERIFLGASISTTIV